ncbi:UDP-N-acetylmuramate: L-alanyl-gamma-D-glutamyl-meso-diaminopimelate ligase [Ectothiorhodosinus mongolicus]|uniref:UDP-N-acetylmuramate--L-alanyl-gamma-D-glutamyl-meso-2,6-diaminoheptandioate ligase n=1 Tax=Ectothiorhodosinus mongolicus TaxID=233100 RepID=A0A1R3VMZ6_9GAMM|nr:UDP-N-acetylmuramate:L-alanyl-gamma-D-glutamyl-meso-diaminopimelate ligase [Ectothiorhodosinus mongolicus]ULX56427.1 UDP-N-acetylmuramate:L-alanyl-gamma-D-glutamyl-meso-diaminopimelate ligase [Ectothiorhodosinus mongolicus]SIT65960.1 UDP-N-acetylmuramate: L-alanyl-gamma-D-glutamyl-meso-diaminopimelate ligase [Ectothiorhodosinus mongolicus]
MKHIHILGIGGTFMGGIALLAKAAGYHVTGSDTGVYPPMSTLLAEQGITFQEGYDPNWGSYPNVVVGNVISRGNPSLEYVLNQGLAYTSGPQWLAEHVLKDRWVLAVAGTHGKTTTASILAWILEYAGLEPGFLIGGVPGNFGVSARLGRSPFFVVEADEYDTAFCDKRSKFVHYHPRTLILNNLEFDHADIFPDLAAIERQFHHLIRIVPGNGLVISRYGDEALERVLAQGLWTPVTRFGTDSDADWGITPALQDAFPMPGQHNQLNALAALLAARHAGVALEVGIEALSQFQGVKRRLELRGEVGGIRVYDDFAHHPTAIGATIAALRQHVGSERVIAVLEPRSNTMRLGVHEQALAPSLKQADATWVYASPDIGWDVAAAMRPLGDQVRVETDIDALLHSLKADLRPGDHVLIMSNGGFAGLHQRLLSELQGRLSPQSGDQL